MDRNISEMKRIADKINEVFKEITDMGGYPLALLAIPVTDGEHEMAGGMILPQGAAGDDYWMELALLLAKMMTTSAELTTSVFSALKLLAKNDDSMSGLLRDILIPELQKTFREKGGIPQDRQGGNKGKVVS